MRRTAVGCLIGLLFVTSCSNAGGQASSSTNPESPVVTGISQQFETTWQPADDVEQIAQLAGEALRGAGASVLIPAALPAQVSGSVGRLWIRETVPTGLVYVDVNVSFQWDGREMALSLTSAARGAASWSCEERIMGPETEGSPTWEATEIGTTLGCLATNDAGLTFIEWEENPNRYHVETRMEPTDALAWLASWTDLP